MKKNILLIMMLSASSAMLIGCGGDDHSNKTTDNVASTPPEQHKINSIQILDANNQPIQNAEVKILSSNQWGTAYQQNSDVLINTTVLPKTTDFSNVVLSTNAQGELSVNGLTPDQYYISVKKGSDISITTFVVKQDNVDQSVVLSVPLSCKENVCSSIDAIIGSLSGQVIVNGQAVKNAQVGLSGGAATNGAFVTTLTDDKGNFNLSFNVSKDLAESLKNSKLLINAEGYEAIQKSVAVYSSSSFGNQFSLVPANTNNNIVWRETFEPDSATANQWQKSQKFSQPMWNMIQSNHGIKNNLVGKAVILAPNDSSQGNIPTPPQGNHAYWYGDVASGNFVGELLSAGSTTSDGSFKMSGGTSSDSNYGSITSPPINLSQVQAPISLSFKTWWEIESVNPNNNGFDLMDIQVSTDGGEVYKTLARLNPLSDPKSTLDRAPLPFSNFGFNVAPAVSQQELISLDGFEGFSDVRIKFVFSTEDHLYNGFRGWMIDDVVIQKAKGTFPLFNETHDNGVENGSNVAEQPLPVAKMLKSFGEAVAVKNRWADVAKR